jgi:hypothetical protein
MPKASYADVFDQWAAMVQALEGQDAALDYLAPFQAELKRLLAQGWQLRKRQLEMKAAFQQSTADLQELVSRGEELRRRLRHGLRGKISNSDPRLVRFRIPPQGRPAKKLSASRAATSPGAAAQAAAAAQNGSHHAQPAAARAVADSAPGKSGEASPPFFRSPQPRR